MSASGFASLLLLGCEQGLVDATYRGEPLFEVSGQVVADPDSEPQPDIRVSFKWISADGTERGSETPEALTTEFPAQYWLALFVPPPDEVFRPSDQGVDHAISRPILYPDRNHDDLWDPRTEDPVGDGGDVHLIWMEEAFMDLPQGYSMVIIDAQPPRFDEMSPLDPDDIDLYVYGAP